MKDFVRLIHFSINLAKIWSEIFRGFTWKEIYVPSFLKYYVHVGFFMSSVAHRLGHRIFVVAFYRQAQLKNQNKYSTAEDIKTLQKGLIIIMQIIFWYLRCHLDKRKFNSILNCTFNFSYIYRPEMNLLLKNYFNAETETLLPKIMMDIVLFI